MWLKKYLLSIFEKFAPSQEGTGTKYLELVA